MTPRKITNYITSKEVEFIIKKLPTWKSSGPDGFTGDSYHTSDNNNDTNNNTSASQTLPKNGGGRSLLSEKHYFYALIPKPNTSQEKKTTDHYPSRIDVKIFNKILANETQQHIKVTITSRTRWELPRECKVGSTEKINLSNTYHLKRKK